MEKIKASEVSSLLKQQLEKFDASSKLEEVGTVLTVGDGIATAFGLANVESNELVEVGKAMGVVLNLDQDSVGIVLMNNADEVKEGDTVKRTGRIASIRVGDEMVGRVVNTLGEPIDGKGAIGGKLYEMPLERKAPQVLFRQPVKRPLQTGIKAIDSMIPIGRGRR